MMESFLGSLLSHSKVELSLILCFESFSYLVEELLSPFLFVISNFSHSRKGYNNSLY